MRMQSSRAKNWSSNCISVAQKADSNCAVLCTLCLPWWHSVVISFSLKVSIYWTVPCPVKEKLKAWSLFPPCISYLCSQDVYCSFYAVILLNTSSFFFFFEELWRYSLWGGLWNFTVVMIALTVVFKNLMECLTSFIPALSNNCDGMAVLEYWALLILISSVQK